MELSGTSQGNCRKSHVERWRRWRKGKKEKGGTGMMELGDASRGNCRKSRVENSPRTLGVHPPAPLEVKSKSSAVI